MKPSENNATVLTTDYDYEYDYDMDDSANTFFWSELLPTLIVYSLTLLIGIVGNSLIIFTITAYRRMKSTTNLFLASLASADLLLVLICIPVKPQILIGIVGNSFIIFTITAYRRMKSTANLFLANLASADLLLILTCIPVKMSAEVAKLFSYSWTMGLTLCKLVHYMQGVSAICSVLTLTAISLERYYAIVHPMKAKYVCTMSQARKIIYFLWVISFFLAIPILFVQIQMPVGEKYHAFWCVRDWDRREVWKVHEVYMFLLILVLPASVMAVTYSAICKEIYRVVQRRSVMTSGKAALTFEYYQPGMKKVGFIPKMRMEEVSTTVKQMIKMLVAVVVVFVVCWGPLLTDNLLTACGILPALRTGSLKHMATAFHLMAYFNSCINPIVYGFMSKGFRDSFTKVLCCCGKTTKREPSVTASMRTTESRLYMS